jgi:N-acetylmuramoyl-L-alanine amidase
MRFIVLVICLFLPFQSALAAVDIALRGKEPVRLEDVYQQNGTPYIAIEDALDAVGLTGSWDSINHKFRIKSKYGWAEISPASSYLKLRGEFYPLKEKPRFIDGRLRVTDSFILNQLAQLTGRSIYFRNLDPDIDNMQVKETSTLDKLFAFLLNKKGDQGDSLIRAVAIDPGHGGLDTGVIAPSGYKEKQLNLEVAEKLAKQLKMKLGIPIYLSRDGDYELTMEQRLQTAAKEGVDIWLLIHAQAAFSSDQHGVSLFIRPEEVQPVTTGEAEHQEYESDSLLLAREISLALREAAVDVRGIYSSSRLSLGRGNLPTVQIELGFLNNPEELQKLQSPEYQDTLVRALYSGISTFAKQARKKKNETE